MAEDAPRQRLGRGLAALIGDIAPEPATEKRRSGPPRTLPVEFLRPNPRNPRKDFVTADLDDLASSVKERGVVQPILVRPVADAANTYEIIAGERRWRAAQKVGLHDVPVVVLEVSDSEALELAIIENVQRADLNPLEEALGYQQLLDDHDYTQMQLAEVIGKSRSHIANTLRLLKLPESVLAYVRSGKLSAGHARTLVTLPDPEAVARRIVEAGMSVREAEALVETDRRKPGGKAPAAAKDADTRALEKALSDALGLTVAINHGKGGGEVRIRYKTLEQLDGVCHRLKH
ncbi:ParB/RepB/Spo0J family partition protein [Bauldia litoralis]|uniref:Chromosome partitioning protein, ParB family n=1 Tax=Bauldia litoralis TaxID=665467 RepID=A0A1G6BQ71_9HYPH|nr:ParB/RepB/Spo0J family partition protein [Bauldia litoralis]SDB22792.1 chromosome partitioning protein, ParB family [Bauldia litoralis]